MRVCWLLQETLEKPDEITAGQVKDAEAESIMVAKVRAFAYADIRGGVTYHDFEGLLSVEIIKLVRLFPKSSN